MTETKKEKHYRPGIPMSEEELKEWKKTFTDIQESIDNVMGVKDAGLDSTKVYEEGCEK